MPMLQEHVGQPGPRDTTPVPQHEHAEISLSRKLSEESIRTEFCDGPVPDSPRPKTPEQDSTTVSDRAELIERLKRGESPTWVPSRHLESLFQQNTPRSATRSPPKAPAEAPALLPSATITPEKISESRQVGAEGNDRLQDGLNIERPRSALHSGDFTHNESCHDDEPSHEPAFSASNTPYRSNNHSWLATSPPRDFAPLDFGRRRSVVSGIGGDFTSGTSSLSSSLSQSFAYKPPTSPLVQSESNDDMVDLSLPMDNIVIAAENYQTNVSRRNTLHFSQSSSYVSVGGNRRIVHGRQNAHPYQAHQPRRSLTSTPNLNFPSSTPQAPAYPGTRRQSLSSDASPLHHASMVGSYEESILRGRMSTTPSRPLDFMAEIGVLGLGKCKAGLRCPAHVTVPFSAVFYSYSSTAHGRTKSEDGPSPYVGLIDLENGLSNPEEELRAKRKMQSRHPDRRPVEDDDMDIEAGILDGSETEIRTGTPRHKRRSRSPKAPPGGSYRIAEKGMLQVIIKNANKTAVKLFLVSYDLTGMEPGSKTFVRQRSYSDPEDTSSDRPILRYLIQLHICCPTKGRHYLYKSIRVVFANRVPDGKEKLRNEVTYPEPRFSPYKPTRVMLPPAAAHLTGPAAMLAAEKAYRRRSSGFSFAGPPNRHQLDPLDSAEREGRLPSPATTFAGTAARQPFTSHLLSYPGSGSGNNDPIEPVPFNLPRLHRVRSDATSNASDETKDSQLRSPESVSRSAAPTQGSGSSPSLSWTGGAAFEAQPARYDKLSKGDVGYGGNAFVSPGDGRPAVPESLLSKRLRSLGVHSQQEDDS